MAVSAGTPSGLERGLALALRGATAAVGAGVFVRGGFAVWFAARDWACRAARFFAMRAAFRDVRSARFSAARFAFLPRCLGAGARAAAAAPFGAELASLATDSTPFGAAGFATDSTPFDAAGVDAGTAAASFGLIAVVTGETGAAGGFATDGIDGDAAGAGAGGFATDGTDGDADAAGGAGLNAGADGTGADAADGFAGGRAGGFAAATGDTPTAPGLSVETSDPAGEGIGGGPAFTAGATGDRTLVTGDAGEGFDATDEAGSPLAASVEFASGGTPVTVETPGVFGVVSGCVVVAEAPRDERGAGGTVDGRTVAGPGTVDDRVLGPRAIIGDAFAPGEPTSRGGIDGERWSAGGADGRAGAAEGRDATTDVVGDGAFAAPLRSAEVATGDGGGGGAGTRASGIWTSKMLEARLAATAGALAGGRSLSSQPESRSSLPPGFSASSLMNTGQRVYRGFQRKAPLHGRSGSG
jgi:hypothetical protein